MKSFWNSLTPFLFAELHSYLEKKLVVMNSDPAKVNGLLVPTLFSRERKVEAVCIHSHSFGYFSLISSILANFLFLLQSFWVQSNYWPIKRYFSSIILSFEIYFLSQLMSILRFVYHKFRILLLRLTASYFQPFFRAKGKSRPSSRNKQGCIYCYAIP